MKNITNSNSTRTINAGAKMYHCPWGDYHNTSFTKVYGHTVGCAYNHGCFGVPIALVKTAVFINGGWAFSLIKKFAS